MNISSLVKQVGFLIAFLFLSWILIHFLAIFGVFLALAIPLLHLVFYPHIICFWCRLKGNPHKGSHSLIDSALILVLTAISIPIIFFEQRLVGRFFYPQSSPKVAQFTIPTRSQYLVGEIFPLKIELTNIPGAINVVQADLSFDPKIVEVTDVTTDQTFADFFIQNEHNNDSGYVRVTGGIPNPGYRKPTGLLATVYLRGKVPGAVKLQYLETSMVLANDGKGTNLLAEYPAIPLIITPEGSSKTTPAPSGLKIRNQVQGDTDKTVLTFSEYADGLPKPFEATLGESSTDSIPEPLSQESQIDLPPLLRLDQFILSFWHGLIRFFTR